MQRWQIGLRAISVTPTLGPFLWLVVCLAPVTLTSPTQRDVQQYLFRASQGGNVLHPPGLWGGDMDHTGTGQAQNLFKYGYSTSNVSHATSSSGQAVRISSVSYDETTDEVLAILQDSSGVGSLTGVAGPLCEADQGSARVLFTRPATSDPDNPYLFDSECGGKCGLGPFAYLNGKVYFILSAVFGQVPLRLTRRVELRELLPCGQQARATIMADFSILQCSTPLVVLHSQTYTKPKPSVDIWPSRSLLAKNISGQVHIFLQLFDTSTQDDLLKIVVAKPGMNTSQVLHSQAVAERYTSNYDIQGFGSMDHSHGYLCWTAANTLLCGNYPSNPPIQTSTVLAPGEANTAGVCTGSLPIPELEQALTGISIADTESSLAVYFGCYSEISGVGGVGLVRLTGHGLVKTVLPVRSGNQKVYGGSIFLTQTVGSNCQQSTTRTPSTSTTASTTSSSQSSTASTIKSSSSTSKSSTSTVLSSSQESTSKSFEMPSTPKSPTTVGGACYIQMGSKLLVVSLVAIYFIKHGLAR